MELKWHIYKFPIVVSCIVKNGYYFIENKLITLKKQMKEELSKGDSAHLLPIINVK